jgi:nitrite reductase (NADH) small subunit
MAVFYRVCGVGELPAEGTAKEFTVDGRGLCVAHAEGALSAMDNECPHRGAPLSEGMIEEGRVVCPWHAWAFDLRTGRAEHSEDDGVQIYEIKVEGSDVYARV